MYNRTKFALQKVDKKTTNWIHRKERKKTEHRELNASTTTLHIGQGHKIH